MVKNFDRLVTGDEYLQACERAARGEIHIEQMIVVSGQGHNWRITGREFSTPQPRAIPRKGSAFTNKQSVFKL